MIWCNFSNFSSSVYLWFKKTNEGSKNTSTSKRESRMILHYLKEIQWAKYLKRTVFPRKFSSNPMLTRFALIKIGEPIFQEVILIRTDKKLIEAASTTPSSEKWSKRPNIVLSIFASTKSRIFEQGPYNFSLIHPNTRVLFLITTNMSS